MEPFALLAAILLVLISLTLPGWLVAWGLGLQGALRAAVAPALSLGIWAGATWIAIGLQLPWRVWLALPLVALVVIPFVVGRLLTLRSGSKAVWPRVPRTSLPRGLWVVAGVCAAISVLPYLIGTRLGARVPQTWDVVFHLSAIRYTRETGSASPWIAFTQLNGGRQVYYPNIFHNIVALLPVSPVAVFEAMMIAVLVLWPLIIGAFTLQAMVTLRGASQSSFTMSGLAMLGAALGANFPANYVANLATPPYTLSLLATPGLVALAVSMHRLRPVTVRYPRSSKSAPSEDSPTSGALKQIQKRASSALLSSQLAPWLALGIFVGLAGVVSTHPSSLFNLVLLLGVPVSVLTVRGWREWQAARSVKILLPLAVIAAVAGASWLVLIPRLRAMASFANPNQNLWTNTWRMFADYPKGPFNLGFGVSGALFSLAALYGLVTLLRAGRLGWLTSGFIVSWVFYLLAAGPVWPGYFLTTPWYLQFSRLAPLVLMCELPLASFGFVLLLERLEIKHLTSNRIRGPQWFTALLVVVLLVASLGGTNWGRFEVVEGAYNPQKIIRGTMLTGSERDFIHRQAETLPDDALIWAAPYNGSPFWWILEGKHVVFPSLSWPGGENLEVIRDLHDGIASEQTCNYFKKIGVTHYFVDTDKTAAGARSGDYAWLWREKNVSFRVPDALLTKVAENPTNPQDLGGFAGQRLYKVNLDACAK